MTRKIAFVNEKGGSCKTTLSVNTAAYLAMKRKRKVLLADLDPQGQVGKSLGFKVGDLKTTVSELLLDPSHPAEEAILPTRIPGLDVMLSNKRLTDFPVLVAGEQDRAVRLRRVIDRIKGYDYIVFDSPPSLGLITVNIMLAANEIVIPVSLTYLALDGCAEIMETVESVKSQFKKRNLGITLVVPTLYRSTRLANAILERLHKYFGNKVSKNVIGFNVKIDEAQSVGQTIWEYAPSSPGARMLEGLAKELESRKPED